MEKPKNYTHEETTDNHEELIKILIKLYITLDNKKEKISVMKQIIKILDESITDNKKKIASNVFIIKRLRKNKERIYTAYNKLINTFNNEIIDQMKLGK